MDLDLTSTTQSISASVIGHPEEVHIDVGGTVRPVGSSDLLTPAEYLAALQVVGSGQQSIILNGQGAATGGSFDVHATLTQSVSNLVIPTGVTAVHDFASSGTLSVAGNLVNSGSLYGVSTNQAVTAGTFSATNIINNQGALLSSVLPSTGLAGYDNLVNSLTLNLNAVNEILNYGTIASSGNLNLTAGQQIFNGPNPA